MKQVLWCLKICASFVLLLNFPLWAQKSVTFDEKEIKKAIYMSGRVEVSNNEAIIFAKLKDHAGIGGGSCAGMFVIGRDEKGHILWTYSNSFCNPWTDRHGERVWEYTDEIIRGTHSIGATFMVTSKDALEELVKKWAKILKEVHEDIKPLLEDAAKAAK